MMRIVQRLIQLGLNLMHLRLFDLVLVGFQPPVMRIIQRFLETGLELIDPRLRRDCVCHFSNAGILLQLRNLRLKLFQVRKRFIQARFRFIHTQLCSFLTQLKTMNARLSQFGTQCHLTYPGFNFVVILQRVHTALEVLALLLNMGELITQFSVGRSTRFFQRTRNLLKFLAALLNLVQLLT